MDRLILFDIDGTLLKGDNAAHKMAFSQAFEKVFKIDTAIDIIDHSGKTDKQIIIEVLKKKGAEESIIREKMEEIIKEMTTIFEESIKNKAMVLSEGVKELLDDLKNKNVLTGLITGNLEDIARTKLKKAGLNDYFKFGGFGSDDEKRANLVKIAIKRAEDNFNFKFNNNVFIVGDTPRDIKAGKEVGVKTIGVTTGIYSKEQLENADADFVLENLKDTNTILELMKYE